MDQKGKKDKKNWEILQEFLGEGSLSLLKNGLKHFLGREKESIPKDIKNDFIGNMSKAIEKLINIYWTRLNADV